MHERFLIMAASREDYRFCTVIIDVDVVIVVVDDDVDIGFMLLTMMMMMMVIMMLYYVHTLIMHQNIVLRFFRRDQQ